MTKKEIEQWRKYSEWVDAENIRRLKAQEKMDVQFTEDAKKKNQQIEKDNRKLLRKHHDEYLSWNKRKPNKIFFWKYKDWEAEKPAIPRLKPLSPLTLHIGSVMLKEKTEIGFREWLIKQ